MTASLVNNELGSKLEKTAVTANLMQHLDICMQQPRDAIKNSSKNTFIPIS
jgi:hypothetical protein